MLQKYFSCRVQWGWRMVRFCQICPLVKFLMWNNRKSSMVHEIGDGFFSLTFTRVLLEQGLARIIQWIVVARSERWWFWQVHVLVLHSDYWPLASLPTTGCSQVISRKRNSTTQTNTKITGLGCGARVEWMVSIPHNGINSLIIESYEAY